MKQTQTLLIGTILSLAVIYAVFWSYVHFGSKKVKEINASDWIMKKRETVQRPAIRLQGPGNFRDVGKIYIDSQRFVTTGVLFRSDSPSKFTESDWKKLRELGITLIIDLRSEKEAEGDPYRPVDGIRHIRNPVYNDDPVRSVISHILFHRSKLNDMMANAYIRMIHERAKSFGQSLRLLADNLDHGTIIHCTAGKDRTGLIIAMILELMGVDRKTTLYDYSLSNNGFESNYKAFLEIDDPKLE
jgi:protein-tyrosine phosphatase